MNYEELTIAQAKEIVRMFSATPVAAATSAPSKTVNYGYAIVVLDRGFVYIGDVACDGDMCHISGASNVRYWGTTGGLGQLALTGPTDKTKSDAVGNVYAPMHAVISIIRVIPVAEAAWKR